MKDGKFKCLVEIRFNELLCIYNIRFVSKWASSHSNRGTSFDLFLTKDSALSHRKNKLLQVRINGNCGMTEAILQILFSGAYLNALIPVTSIPVISRCMSCVPS